MRKKEAIPSPDEMAEASKRIAKFKALRFEVDLGDGVWRMVCLGSHVPLRNPIKPELSMLVFRAFPVIGTPYLSEIEGTFWITLDGLTAGKVTWIAGKTQQYLSGRKYGEEAKECKFRCLTEEAGLWLHRELAKACGMKFREHDIGGHIIYTRDP